jgi:hypothetical protein
MHDLIDTAIDTQTNRVTFIQVISYRSTRRHCVRRYRNHFMEVWKFVGFFEVLPEFRVPRLDFQEFRGFIRGSKYEYTDDEQ